MNTRFYKFGQMFEMSLFWNGLEMLRLRMYLHFLQGVRVLKIINNFLAMTKKIPERSLRIQRTHVQTQIINTQQLKKFAAQKVRQLQMSKLKPSKISKEPRSARRKPTRPYPVQKEMFQEIIQQSAFQCPVCLELMIQPTLLECGHAYCLKCIEELMIYKSNCGVCRNVQKQPQFQKSKYLEGLIEKLVLTKSENFLDFYCRLADTQTWKKARNVSICDLNKGSFIDFRDKELKWRKAEITKIINDQKKGLHVIEVKYKRDGQNEEETIFSDSGRYAKFSYYTRMKYLEPRYQVATLLTSGFEEPLLTPIPSSFAEITDDMGEFQGDQAFENQRSNQRQNSMHGESTILPIFQEDQFLTEIFQPRSVSSQEMIEILG